MASIIKHIFSNKDNIPIFKDKEGKVVQGHMSKGEWMGLLKELPNRVQVISSKFVGWINRSDFFENNTQMKHLHSIFQNGDIHYVIPS